MTAQHEKLREDFAALFLTLAILSARSRNLGMSEDDLGKLAMAGALIDEVCTGLGRRVDEDGAP